VAFTTDIGPALGLLEIVGSAGTSRREANTCRPGWAADTGEMAASDAESETTPGVRAQQCRPSSTCARGAPLDPRSRGPRTRFPRAAPAANHLLHRGERAPDPDRRFTAEQSRFVRRRLPDLPEADGSVKWRTGNRWPVQRRRRPSVLDQRGKILFLAECRTRARTRHSSPELVVRAGTPYIRVGERTSELHVSATRSRHRAIRSRSAPCPICR
jgi:hypothetical protein